MAFGGPYLGIMACREQFVRRMPGRLVGQTVDRRGKRCWVLTLQTREQHIRREKATSNICTNQGLLALRATVYLALMGPAGMRSVAELCLQKAHYAAERLAAVPSLSLAFDRPTFKEFVVRVKGRAVDELIEKRPREKAFSPACRWAAGIRSWPTACWWRSPRSGPKRRSTGWRAFARRQQFNVRTAKRGLTGCRSEPPHTVPLDHAPILPRLRLRRPRLPGRLGRRRRGSFP